MSARNVNLELTYENINITKDVQNFLESFRYVDRTLHDKMDELSITLQDVDGLWRGEWFPQAGAKFKATIKASNWFNVGDYFEIDCGVFEIDDLTSSGPPTTFTIAAISVGITNSIRGQQNYKDWKSENVKEIAEDIAQKNKFGLEFYSDCNPKIKRWEQKSQSDLSCLKALCEYTGLMLKITNKSLIIFGGEEFDKKMPEITINIKKSGVKSWNFNSNSSDIYSACEVKYYDIGTRELFEYRYVPDGISGTRGGSDKKTFSQSQSKEDLEITEPEVGKILKINQRVEGLKEAENFAKAALRSKNMRMMTGNMTLLGRPDLHSGMTINVKGFGVWDSVIWSVEEITHDYSRSGYSSTLQLRGILGY